MALHIILQAGNATGIINAINEIGSTTGAEFFGAVLAAGGLSFMIAIAMALFYFIEHQIHPTSFGRSAAISEVYSHIKKIIGGAIGIWLFIYIVFTIISMAGVTGINPTAVAGEVFTAEFKWLYYFLNIAIKHAVASTP